MAERRTKQQQKLFGTWLGSRCFTAQRLEFFSWDGQIGTWLGSRCSCSTTSFRQQLNLIKGPCPCYFHFCSFSDSLSTIFGGFSFLLQLHSFILHLFWLLLVHSWFPRVNWCRLQIISSEAPLILASSARYASSSDLLFLRLTCKFLAMDSVSSSFSFNSECSFFTFSNSTLRDSTKLRKELSSSAISVMTP